MSAIAEAFPQQAIAGDLTSSGAEHMLALVQGDVVVSTFPEDQTAAAIDLARVLCRALAQPVDLFRVRCSKIGCVQAGALADTGGPGWTRLIHLRATFPLGIDIKVCDPAMQEKIASQFLTP